jgi:hypothetical protein
VSLVGSISQDPCVTLLPFLPYLASLSLLRKGRKERKKKRHAKKTLVVPCHEPLSDTHTELAHTLPTPVEAPRSLPHAGSWERELEIFSRPSKEGSRLETGQERDFALTTFSIPSIDGVFQLCPSFLPTFFCPVAACSPVGRR